jgi:hypothetical protein
VFLTRKKLIFIGLSLLAALRPFPGGTIMYSPGSDTMTDDPLQHEPLELLEATEVFKPASDRRPRMPEPLPVKMVTVEDAWLIMAAGLEVQLDDFYVGLLGFERVDPMDHAIVYRAENFALHFEVLEPLIRRETLRALGIEVLSLAQTEDLLIAREIPYTRQKGLIPGQESLMLLDPAGNWLQLTESRAI